MAETALQLQFEDPHHLERLIRRLSASSIWGRMRFFAAVAEDVGAAQKPMRPQIEEAERRRMSHSRWWGSTNCGWQVVSDI